MFRFWVSDQQRGWDGNKTKHGFDALSLSGSSPFSVKVDVSHIYSNLKQSVS